MVPAGWPRRSARRGNIASTSRMVSRMARAARGSSAPISRFSSTVSDGKICRPSATWPMPRLQMRWLGKPVMSLAAEADAARAGRLDAGDGADQARLAGAVGADDGDQLALPRPKRDAVQRLRVAVEEIEVFDCEDHAPPPRRGSIRARPDRASLRRGALSDDLAVVQDDDALDSAMTARMTCSISRMVRPARVEVAEEGHHAGPSRSGRSPAITSSSSRMRGPVASARATSRRLRSGSVSEDASWSRLAARPSCSRTCVGLLAGLARRRRRH